MVTINNLITTESILAFLSGILLMILIIIIYYSIKLSSKKNKMLSFGELEDLIKTTKENIDIANKNLNKLDELFISIKNG